MGAIFIRLVRRGRAALAVVAVVAAAAPCAAQQPGRTVTVAGRVIDSLTQPIAGADVAIDSLHLATETDAYGRFRLADVPAGAYFLSVRRPGYGPVDVAIATPRDTSLTPVILVRGAVVLRTIVTRTVGLFGKPSRLAYTRKFDGFYERRAYGIGVARFYTREDIDRMNVQDFRDILRRVPHLQLWDDGGRTVLKFPRCGTGGIMIRLNGMQVWPLGGQMDSDATLAQKPTGEMDGNSGPDPTASDPLEALRTMTASDIEAMEVYPNSSSLPAQAVGNACAAIFVWTR